MINTTFTVLVLFNLHILLILMIFILCEALFSVALEKCSVNKFYYFYVP